MFLLEVTMGHRTTYVKAATKKQVVKKALSQQIPKHIVVLGKFYTSVPSSIEEINKLIDE